MFIYHSVVLESKTPQKDTFGNSNLMSKKLEIRGLTLFPHQRDVMNDIISHGPDSQHIFCVKSSRQKGKSILLTQCLLYHAINHARSINICVSLTMSNVRKLYTELVNGMLHTGVISKHNDSLLTVEFTNGSVIYYKSIQQKENLRGFSIRGGGILTLDEVAYYPEDVFPILWPWCDASRANTLMVSTPRMKSGTFFDYYTLGMDPSNSKITSYDWSSSKYDFSKLISEEQIELYRKTLPQNQFISEVLGEFTDSAGSVFQMQFIKWSKTPPDPNTYSKIFIGIDWSAQTGNDFTVVSGFNERCEQVLLKYNNTLTPQECIKWITKEIETLDPKKIDTILVESNSIGAIYYDLLKSALPKMNIKVFITTNDSKRLIVEDFCSAIGEEKVTLLQDNEQQRQLSCYAMEITPTGKVTYNGHLDHDDICISDCIAYHAIKLKMKTSYNISFGRR